jgi:hypothetical protein
MLGQVLMVLNTFPVPNSDRHIVGALPSDGSPIIPTFRYMRTPAGGT